MADVGWQRRSPGDALAPKEDEAGHVGADLIAEGVEVGQVEALQIGAAKDATIPAGVTLLGSSGPTRDRQSVSAEWSFDAPTDWRPYLEQAEASLR